MLRRLAGLLLAAALISEASAETALDRLRGLRLPTTATEVELHYSPSAKSEAAHYAAELEKAIAWYREKLGWQGTVAMAVLAPDDWRTVVSSLPYPTPHTERSTGLVVMADRIESHDGFDRWDLDAIEANASLTFHEVGHLIARQIGLWSGNNWVNEFVANVFLAGYVRNAAPSYAKVLMGVPPRFADAAVFKALADFDDLAFGVGPRNYAWFQFRLMALADFLVTGSDFATIVAGLRRAFPIENEYTTLSLQATLDRMEAIKPGFAKAAGDLLTASAVAKLAPSECGEEKEAAAEETLLIVDNFTDTPLALNTRRRIDVLLRSMQRRGKIPKDADLAALTEEALGTEAYAAIVEPFEHVVLPTAPGTQWHIPGAGCITIPAGHARLEWMGE